MKGIVILSHAKEIAVGVSRLLDEVAKDVPITMSGGLEDGSIGTSFDLIKTAIESNPATELYAFYDLGSAKINCEMVMEVVDKQVTILDVPLIEGSYITAALLQTGVDDDVIQANLAPLQVK